MRFGSIILFVLLLFNTAFSGLMLNRARADWHTRFGRNVLAVQIEPWDWHHHFRLSLDYMREQKVNESLRSLQAAYRLAPYHWPILNNIALIYAINGDLDRAEALWEELVKVFPYTQSVRVNLAVLKAKKTQ